MIVQQRMHLIGLENSLSLRRYHNDFFVQIFWQCKLCEKRMTNCINHSIYQQKQEEEEDDEHCKNNQICIDQTLGQ